LAQLKSPKTSLEIEPATFWLNYKIILDHPLRSPINFLSTAFHVKALMLLRATGQLYQLGILVSELPQL
jgi:hypothetical protein